MAYIEINNFNDIEINSNSLIICDIDETVLTYRKNLRYFIELNKQISPNPSIYYFKALEDYEFYKINEYYDDIIHTDLEGFYNMIDKINQLNGNIIFLTARHHSSNDYTRKQLSSINIHHHNYSIYYTGNTITKGDYIKLYLDIDGYDEIIFIDDLDFNLNSVYETNPKIKCYKFVKKMI